jgi:prephenate dehydrogenase
LAAGAFVNSVAIVGVGLIGSSFGLALREYGFAGQIVGVSSAAALEAAKKVGAIDGSASLREAAGSADLIYLAQPVDRILITIEKLPGLVRSGALVTDAGSTKAAIVRQAQRCLAGIAFIGGHPIAGKEQRGAEASEAQLFNGKPYVLTPQGPSTALTDSFRWWLEKIGARVVEMQPEEHDATVALTSHLPQVLSTSLALTLARQSNPNAAEIFGTGLLDMTRLALSSPDLWTSILATNKPAVLAAIEAYSASLADLRRSLESDTVVELFEVGASWAKRIREQHRT